MGDTFFALPAWLEQPHSPSPVSFAQGPKAACEDQLATLTTGTWAPHTAPDPCCVPHLSLKRGGDGSSPWCGLASSPKGTGDHPPPPGRASLRSRVMLVCLYGLWGKKISVFLSRKASITSHNTPLLPTLLLLNWICSLTVVQSWTLAAYCSPATHNASQVSLVGLSFMYQSPNIRETMSSFLASLLSIGYSSSGSIF